MKAFPLNLAEAQPTQLYISRAKLAAVRGAAPEALAPVPVKVLDGTLICTDGHTRALAAWQAGLQQVAAVWEEDELDWEAYRICVDWCKAEGIATIAELAHRVVDDAEYERLWLARCRRMHKHLHGRRPETRRPAP